MSCHVMSCHVITHHTSVCENSNSFCASRCRAIRQQHCPPAPAFERCRIPCVLLRSSVFTDAGIISYHTHVIAYSICCYLVMIHHTMARAPPPALRAAARGPRWRRRLCRRLSCILVYNVISYITIYLYMFLK